jgi:hypothetical protein
MGKMGGPLDLWSISEAFLPSDLESLAQSCGAIVRPRRVEDASQLLRAFLLYAQAGSFQTATALTRGSGLLNITAEGLFYRLSRSELFLEKVLAHLVGLSTAVPIGYRLVIVDATTITGPGSKGTDWRVHVGYDPIRGLPCSLSVTAPGIGEKLALHTLQQGQLVVADRGYGTARNVNSAFEAGVDFLIRLSNKEVRFYDHSGQKLIWDNLARQVPLNGPASFPLRLPVPKPGLAPGWAVKPENILAWREVRLIGARNRQGEVVWLVTNLESGSLSDEQACEIYRARWQVELYFKRLKSLGDLDMQPSRDGPTARAGLLAKLILLVLTSLIQDQEQAFSPYGYPISQARAQHVERVRLHPQATRRRPSPQKAPPKTHLYSGLLF